MINPELINKKVKLKTGETGTLEGNYDDAFRKTFYYLNGEEIVQSDEPILYEDVADILKAQDTIYILEDYDRFKFQERLDKLSKIYDIENTNMVITDKFKLYIAILRRIK